MKSEDFAPGTKSPWHRWEVLAGLLWEASGWVCQSHLSSCLYTDALPAMCGSEFRLTTGVCGLFWGNKTGALGYECSLRWGPQPR